MDRTSATAWSARLLALPLRFVLLAACEVRPHLRIIWTVAKDLGELGLSFIIPAVGRQFGSQQKAGLPKGGHLQKQGPKTLNRLSRPMQCGQSNRAVEVIRRTLRLEACGFIIMDHRPCNVTPSLLQESQVEICVYAVRVRFASPGKRGDGFINLLLAGED